ncbi:hypothetical protein [Frankia nepalensis]|uniref:Uncharacterized protein n=1 Tax=Frankia nepalensis TaxID=1836974 RepID=A0A937RMH4_9ACTN|nr:hypothetical protein [Frankia nepalensis]MBL7499376.1 hypothetical protein [Frankia nepalensis]MBL7512809.1 hypothetical protein [Frankia nepalensis]MBL7631519.1 hypothetical protein [Frankia nepalensis]
MTQDEDLDLLRGIPAYSKQHQAENAACQAVEQGPHHDQAACPTPARRRTNVQVTARIGILEPNRRSNPLPTTPVPPACLSVGLALGLAVGLMRMLSFAWARFGLARGPQFTFGLFHGVRQDFRQIRGSAQHLRYAQLQRLSILDGGSWTTS